MTALGGFGEAFIFQGLVVLDSGLVVEGGHCEAWVETLGARVLFL